MLLDVFDTFEAEILEKKTPIRFFCIKCEDLRNQEIFEIGTLLRNFMISSFKA